jgi:Flp pilus assembly protein TadD
MSEAPREGTIPRRRVWLLPLVTFVGLPALALVALEVGLRVAGVGYNTSFTRECTSRDAAAVCDNPSFTWQFFPREIARAPVSFAFPAERAPSSYRIFVVGGSAAQGDPEPSYGFARILEVLLAERYPGVRFEVIDAGVTAINSHVVLPIVRDLARHDGDLFVVYLGNNEVVGPFGAGTIFSPLAGNLRLIRTGMLVRATRVGQLLAGLEGSRDLPEEWGGLEMFVEQRVAHDDPRMEALYGHFRENLGDILDRARGSGAPVVVSTVGVNLRSCAPFAEIDGHPADPQYRLARDALTRGDVEAARSAFERARDLDALRFRADSRINAVIRAVAGGRSAEGVWLVDAEAALGLESPHGIPGAELFDDHVHLNFAGNYVVAREMLRTIERFLPQQLGRDPLPSALLTVDQAAARLAFTGFDRRRVVSDLAGRLSGPPFTGQSDHDEQMERLREELASLARFGTPEGYADAEAVYRTALGVAPDDPWLRYNHAELLGAAGAHDAAASELRTFLRVLPQDVPAREKLANALTAADRFEEAVAECVALHEQEPEFAPPYFTRAFALARLGRLDESLAVYRHLLELDPDSAAEIHNEIARIELHRGRPEAALDALGEAIRLHDADSTEPIPDLRYNYAVALTRAGRGDEARAVLGRAEAEYRRVIREQGPSAALRVALGSVLVTAGDLEGAAGEFREALLLDPADFRAHEGLVRSLQALGRGTEATAAARVGIRELEARGRSEEAAALGRFLR